MNNILREISWRQKVRERCIKEGDRNIRYFHCLANHQRRFNYVDELIVDNQNIEGNIAMREEANASFSNLYQEDFGRRPRLDNMLFKELDNDDRVNLKREFMEEEIKDALKYFNGDKTPGLKSFNMRFLQKF